MKKNGSTKAKASVEKKTASENIHHALLRVLGADLHHLLAVCHRRLRRAVAVELDVCLDELHRAIGAGRHRLRGSAGEPVNNGAAGNQPEHEGRVQHRELVHIGGKPVRQRHDDGENHRSRAHNGGSNQHRLGRRLEGVPRPVVLLE